jgi:hypothetical protein
VLWVFLRLVNAKIDLQFLKQGLAAVPLQLRNVIFDVLLKLFKRLIRIDFDFEIELLLELEVNSDGESETSVVGLPLQWGRDSPLLLLLGGHFGSSVRIFSCWSGLSLGNANLLLLGLGLGLGGGFLLPVCCCCCICVLLLLLCLLRGCLLLLLLEHVDLVFARGQVLELRCRLLLVLDLGGGRGLFQLLSQRLLSALLRFCLHAWVLLYRGLVLNGGLLVKTWLRLSHGICLRVLLGMHRGVVLRLLLRVRRRLLMNLLGMGLVLLLAYLLRLVRLLRHLRRVLRKLFVNVFLHLGRLVRLILGGLGLRHVRLRHVLLCSLWLLQVRLRLGARQDNLWVFVGVGVLGSAGWALLLPRVLGRRVLLALLSGLLT